MLTVRVCPSCRSIYAEEIKFCGIDGSQLVVQDEDPLLGFTLGRYKIGKRLGAGAMGVVYRAKHEVLETEFAVKVLFGEHGANETVTKRFRREAQAISKIKHPNIVSIVDFGTQEGGLSYLVMELVEGPTLQEIIHAEAPLEVTRTKIIARHIAEGLAEAHHHGFVHRDLKPGNIIIERRRSGEVAKILDFGLVTITDSESSQTRLTKTGHTVGTPAYMAPEQTRSSKVSPSADLYSLGVIIYEMLSGRLPFQGETADVLIKKCMEMAPPLPAMGGIENLAMRLIERDPLDRYQTADETVQAIDGMLSEADIPTISGVNHFALSGAFTSSNALSNPAQPFVSPDDRPLSETAALEVTAARAYSETDALARTSPSVRIRTVNADASVAALPIAPSSSTKKSTLGLLLAGLLLVGVGFYFMGPQSKQAAFVSMAETDPMTPEAEPEIPKPEIPKPEIPKPEIPKPEIPKPEIPKPEIPKPEIPKPEIPKPEMRRARPKHVARTRTVKQVSEKEKPAMIKAPRTVSKRRGKAASKSVLPKKSVSNPALPKSGTTKSQAPKAVAPARASLVAKPRKSRAKTLGPGFLQIVGITWWDVHIDGVKKYRHPAKPRSLKPGDYVIELRNFNCKNSPVRRKLKIKSGEKTKFRPVCRRK